MLVDCVQMHLVSSRAAHTFQSLILPPKCANQAVFLSPTLPLKTSRFFSVFLLVQAMSPFSQLLKPQTLDPSTLGPCHPPTQMCPSGRYSRFKKGTQPPKS